MEEQLHSKGNFLFFDKDYVAEFVYGGIEQILDFGSFGRFLSRNAYFGVV